MNSTHYKIRMSDIILSVAIIAISISMYFFFYLDGKNSVGKQVIVTLDGKEYGQYPINKDNVIKIKSADGYNTIQIKDGKVTMKEADCPDKYCVSHKGITRKNESIVCLPHKLSVEISDDENSSDDNEEIDAVVR